ncbi:MAG: hypothetical protein WCI92_10055 [Bacteroidota bacterium]
MHRFVLDNINKESINRFFLVSIILLLIIFVLAPFYGILPISNTCSLAIMYTALGNIDCLSKMGLCTPCAFSGLPLGGYMPFGLPYAYISSVIQILIGVSVIQAYNLTGFVFLFLGWIGVFYLIRNFGGNLFFSILGSFLFLFMPIVWAKSNYVFLMWAFASLPIFILLDIILLKTKRLLIYIPLIFLSKIFLIFLEPYTFVMASLFTGGFILFETFSLSTNISTIYKPFIKIITLSVAPFTAYLLYKNYIPDGANYSIMPMDFLRGQGIDLIAFFNRSSNLYAFESLWNVKITNPRLFFTDGESVFNVYFGISFLLVLPLIYHFRKRLHSYHWLFLLIGITTLILSLGPSLKINNQRDKEQITSENFTFNDYLMPSESAVFTMPHAFVYKIAPIKYMRSVSRWLLPTVLIFVIFLMILCSFLWKYNRMSKIFVFIITLLVIYEYTPNYKRRLSSINYQTKSFNKFNISALAEFKSTLNQNDFVLFAQKGGLANEYFSTYLCSAAKCKTYNISTDKAIDLSSKQWPKKVYEFAINPEIKGMKDILESKLATVIVFPHFDLRWDSYNWPPKEKTKTEFLEFAKQFELESKDMGFISKEWFSYIRLKQ